MRGWMQRRRKQRSDNKGGAPAQLPSASPGPRGPVGAAQIGSTTPQGQRESVKGNAAGGVASDSALPAPVKRDALLLQKLMQGYNAASTHSQHATKLLQILSVCGNVPRAQHANNPHLLGFLSSLSQRFSAHLLGNRGRLQGG